ncbi:MAG TPA: hypothetical protein VLL52_16010 [Anaerolineae bacterium]|nr:hypothetical protein [Anaerolineae bacterium]
MVIEKVPKAELHCHLDGIIGLEMLADICREEPEYPLTPDFFAGAYPVDDLASFFRWWQFIAPIEGELRYFQPILGRYMAQLKRDGVRYAEVMIAAGELPRDVGRVVAEVGAFREWVNEQEGGEIQVEFLVAIGRSKTVAQVENIARRVLILHEAGLVHGVALAGPERGYPVKPFTHILAELHEAGVGIEIHAGEWCGSESVWDALTYGYPDRIGHGVTLFEDQKLVEIFQERQIHIEMCPTSNLLTGSVAQLEAHPIGLARELGLNFSVNTDDPGPFGCTMGSECQLLVDLFGFDEGDFKQMYRNALGARFGGDLRI